MQYKYVTAQADYSDISSGRVFHSLPGHPAFPVRLASEIFQRCLAARATIYGESAPATLYDPCCGTAYHLSVLGFLHGESMKEVIASDIDEQAVALAKRNLQLLNVDGMDKRIAEISSLLELYKKDSHRDALASALVLKDKISRLTRDHSIATKVFQANGLDREAISKNISPASVDIIFTDVPYGQHSHWQTAREKEVADPIWSLLDTMRGILSASSIVAIVSDKGQKAMHERYQRVEQFQIGKRRIALLKPG